MRATLRLLALFTTLAVFALPGGAPARDTGEPFIDKDLKGWEGVSEYWSYKDGAVIGSAPKGLKGPNTFLCSKKKYGDFEMSFKVRLAKGAGNSGVQIRSKITNPKVFGVSGPQADIGAGYWGSLYGEGFGGMMKAAPAASQKTVKPGDFNDYSIRCVGKHVTIKVNGVTTVDEDFAKMPPEGIIAFQLHSGGPMEVTFKDIVFKEIASKKE